MSASATRPHWSETLAHPVRSFHTVRHLHAIQVLNRAVRPFQHLTNGARRAGDMALLRRAPSRPAETDRSVFDGHSFHFLNRRILWGGADRWHPRGVDALWSYNLHYFQFLWSVPPRVARELIDDWMVTNPRGQGIGWDAYPISLRVREWLEWLQANPDVDPAFQRAVAQSIADQIEALSRRLEFHLMGNHLLENAITLCWAGLSFDGPLGDAWLMRGVRLLRREIRRQVLGDGCHDERSPMYQGLLAEALLRLSEVAARSIAVQADALYALARTAGERLLGALTRLVHPDGDYALLNDTAFNVAPSLASLVRRFAIVPERPDAHRAWALEAAGYLGYRHGDQYLVFDAGAIGPEHQPGHGHADTLSFELSRHGRRVITDTGVFTYAQGGDRSYDRSTAAHNTVEVDGESQCELWGAFRCGRRSSIDLAIVEGGRSGSTLAGAYHGPGRRGSVWHQREIFVGASVLAFTDSVRASGDRFATARLHLAPGLRVRRSRRGWSIEERSHRSVASVLTDGFDWSESTSAYHPEFGLEQERSSLVAHMPFRDALTMKWWILLN